MPKRITINPDTAWTSHSMEVSEQCGLFVAICFEMRNQAHVAHLAMQGPGSYAAHKALNEFYDGIVDIADTFAESWQGRYGLLSIPLQNASTNPSSGIKELLNQFRSWMQMFRPTLAETPDLQNIVDDAITLVNSTLYKLDMLQ